MNTIIARHLSAKIAELIELASIFQSRYGKDYTMKPGSPREAWELHDAIFNQQVAIASLLDPDALENPLKRLPPWWKWQETIDTGNVNQLAQETNHLIACCAAHEATEPTEVSPIIACSQRVIAGILHPSSLMVAQGEMASKAS